MLYTAIEKLLTAQTSAVVDLEAVVLDALAWADPKRAKTAR